MRRIFALLLLGLNLCAAYASNITLKAGRSTGRVLQTEKIQKAIDKVSRSGGGTVTISGGVFLTAPVELKSGVNLCIAEGATLLGSPQLADYKDRTEVRHFDTQSLPRWRNIALIYADEAENISITGKGTIDCNGHNFVKAKTGENWTGWWYERTVPVRESVPRAVFFAGCRNVSVRDVTLTDLPAGWGYWVHDCDNVTFNGCSILADVHYPNNDGIHVNCSRDVLVENCDIQTGDDAIVLRANSRSLKENRACERVTVRNCRLRSWSSAVRLGWTGDGVIRNCSVSDVEMYDCSNGISCYLPAFKYIEASNDYGREATLVENISFDNIRMDKIYGSPIYVKVDNCPDTKFEAFRNVTFSNISCHALEKPFFNDRSGGGKDVKFSGCNFTIDSVSDYPENARRHGYVGRPKEKYHEPWHVCAFVWPSCHDDSLGRANWEEGIGEWEVIKKGNPRFEGHYQPKEPLWGYEMDNDPAVVEKWINTALEHGVNTFVYDWYWFDHYPYLESALNDGFLKAPSNEKMEFFIMWANHNVKHNYWNYHKWGSDDSLLWTGTIDPADWPVIVKRVISQYFGRPNYTKIDGKPVFAIFSAELFIQSFGTVEAARQAMEYMRRETVAAGFPGLHYMMMSGGGSNPDRKHTERIDRHLGLDPDSWAWYNMGGFDPDYIVHNENAAAMRSAWDERLDIPVFPTVSIGWDDTPRFPAKGINDVTHINQSPEVFEKYLRQAKAYADGHAAQQSRFVFINAWNEWVEGSYLLPDKRYGFGYLQAVQSVFAPENSKAYGVDFSVREIGFTPSGEAVHIYRLENGRGSVLELCDLGARITGISVPDNDGKIADVVPGSATIDGMLSSQLRNNGAVIGRYAGRIDGAAFELDGKKYQLDANQTLDGVPVCCHGGKDGFDIRVWKAGRISRNGKSGVRFTLHSADGESGFPGNCDVAVTYLWDESDVCRIEYSATVDKPTVINLTNHTFFNLSGFDKGGAMDQVLQVDASRYVQCNSRYCPDVFLPVDNSPFDFRQPHRIDWRLNMPANPANRQLEIMGGMSCCLALDRYDGSLRRAASLSSPSTGRRMEVWTTEPAIQLFPGNFFDGSVEGKGGRKLQKYDGVTLETLHYADSPNQDRLPSTVLRPGRIWRSVTEYRFGNTSDELSFACIFTDDMVLQRDTVVTVWGRAPKGSKVTLEASWGDSSVAHADASGRWKARLHTPSAGGPYALKANCGSQTVSLCGILCGEVWICSGQSNMEMPVKGYIQYGQKVEGTDELIAESASYADRIRIFNVERNIVDDAPADYLTGGRWRKSSPESCADCSAIAYYFSRELADSLDVPIGIVIASWGGTGIDVWMPRDLFADVAGSCMNRKLFEKRMAYRSMGLRWPRNTGSLYNGMIHPIAGFAARGFLWYQGESNKNADASCYNILLGAMIERWRKDWGDNSDRMPFYYVLISPYLKKGGDNGFKRGYFVENQRKVATEVPNCAYACTEGLGAGAVIHPPFKKQVSSQLASLALKRDYGFMHIDAGCPEPVSEKISGKCWNLRFSKPLLPVKDVKGFEVAGTDGIFHTASSVLTGECGVTVEIPSGIDHPAFLRYSFRENPESNLVGLSGFPVAPFRTDSLKLK